MAERVVDRLEAVEVDHGQSETGTGGIGDSSGESGEKRPPVGDSGQRVGVRDLIHARLLLQRRLLGPVGALALQFDPGARADQLGEARILQVEQPQDQEDDQSQAEAHRHVGEPRRSGEDEGQRHGEKQQRQPRGDRETCKAIGAAERRERGEQDDEILLRGRRVQDQRNRPVTEGEAQKTGQDERVSQLDDDLLGRENPLLRAKPVSEPGHDEQDEEVGRVGGFGQGSAAGDRQAGEIGERDEVKEGDLLLERAVALLEQGAAKGGACLSDIQQLPGQAKDPCFHGHRA